MLGLLTYPVLVEPYLTSRQQAWMWSISYIAFVLVCSVVAWWSRAGRSVLHRDAPAGPAPAGTSLGRRLTLALLRCGIILLIVLAMLRPTLVYVETHKEKATLVFLIDQSRSMQVRDALIGVNERSGSALVVVTHDPMAAERLGRRVALENGRLVS